MNCATSAKGWLSDVFCLSGEWRVASGERREVRGER